MWTTNLEWRLELVRRRRRLSARRARLGMIAWTGLGLLLLALAVTAGARF